MEYLQKDFLEKLKCADGTIEIIDIEYTDEFDYKHKDIQTFVRLNGFFNVNEFENDLHKSYNEYMDKTITQLNENKTKDKKSKLVFEIHSEFQNIRNLLFIRKNSEMEYFEHKNFTWKNISPFDQYLDRTLDQGDLQEFYYHLNNYINLATEKIKVILEMVKAEGDRLSILYLEQLAKEPKKIKLNVSIEVFGAFINLMINAKIIDSHASVDLAKTIARSFDTKRSTDILSDKSVKNKITTPEGKHIEAAKGLAIKIMNCANAFDK